MIYFLVAAWCISGAASFIFWWTHDHDLTTCQVPMLFVTGLAGPFSFLIGWMVHGNSTASCRTLIRRRSSTTQGG